MALKSQNQPTLSKIKQITTLINPIDTLIISNLFVFLIVTSLQERYIKRRTYYKSRHQVTNSFISFNKWRFLLISSTILYSKVVTMQNNNLDILSIVDLSMKFLSFQCLLSIYFKKQKQSFIFDKCLTRAGMKYSLLVIERI